MGSGASKPKLPPLSTAADQLAVHGHGGLHHRQCLCQPLDSDVVTVTRSLVLPPALIAAAEGSGAAPVAAWPPVVSQQPPPDPQQMTADWSKLLEGVESVSCNGQTSGLLSVFQPHAVALVCDSTNSPVVAAARYGAGRVLAFGHTGFLSSHNSGNRRLLENFFNWLPVRGKAAVLCHMPGSQNVLAQIVGAANARGASPLVNLALFRAIVIRAMDLKTSDVGKLRLYLERGGSVIVFGNALGWALGSPQSLKELPANHLFAPLGILYSYGQAEHSCELPATTVILDHYDCGCALHQLLGVAGGRMRTTPSQFERVFRTSLRALNALPGHLLKSRTPSLPVVFVPTPAAPVTADQLQERACALAWQAFPHAKITEASVKALVKFPGQPAEFAPCTSKVSLRTSCTGWQSTGLFAVPGHPVAVTVEPPSDAPFIQCVIGCHTDVLWDCGGAWQRWPQLCKRYSCSGADGGAQTRTSAHGGLIYLAWEPSQPPREYPVSVTIGGVTKAPQFDMTLPEQQRLSAFSLLLQPSPQQAPWGELVGTMIVFTMPTKMLQQIDDPDRLMTFWDKAVTLFRHFARPHMTQTFSKQHVVFDVQVTCSSDDDAIGHCGAPTVVLLEHATRFFDVDALSNGDDWEPLRLIAQNFQQRLWTLEGFEEEMADFLVLYVVCSTSGRRPVAALPQLRQVLRQCAFHFISGSGRPQDPILRLALFVLLEADFGWIAFKKLFLRYSRTELWSAPETSEDRIGQFVLWFSTAVDCDVGSLFCAWGLPPPSHTLAKLRKFRPWVPLLRPCPELLPQTVTHTERSGRCARRPVAPSAATVKSGIVPAPPTTALPRRPSAASTPTLNATPTSPQGPVSIAVDDADRKFSDHARRSATALSQHAEAKTSASVVAPPVALARARLVSESSLSLGSSSSSADVSGSLASTAALGAELADKQPEPVFEVSEASEAPLSSVQSPPQPDDSNGYIELSELSSSAI
eukprot:m.279296 g.279296  ORF g.279296 m.279296 type:complete len:978 (-) comp19387_c0_seq6:205-3138(-)